jgi:hypothetical protein
MRAEDAEAGDDGSGTDYALSARAQRGRTVVLANVMDPESCLSFEISTDGASFHLSALEWAGKTGIHH